MLSKFRISRDSQALYITIVARDRLPVFQTDAIKGLTWEAIDEARMTGNFLLFAYVIMPNHVHNPVRAGIVDRPIDYLWSSARLWRRMPREDEPLLVDLDRIEWRRA
jgi:REP element-mobilizing transposase RayT